MGVPVRTAVLVLGVAYLAAAVVPCPVPGLDGAADTEVSLQAPCPCGCEHRGVSDASGSKLGPVLGSAFDADRPLPHRPRPPAPTLSLFPEPYRSTDPIPI